MLKFIHFTNITCHKCRILNRCRETLYLGEIFPIPVVVLWWYSPKRWFRYRKICSSCDTHQVSRYGPKIIKKFSTTIILCINIMHSHTYQSKDGSKFSPFEHENVSLYDQIAHLSMCGMRNYPIICRYAIIFCD